MEAASRVATSSQGKLRQQLLNSEQDLSNLDELNYMPNQQQQMQQMNRQSNQAPMMGNGNIGGPPQGQFSTNGSMSNSGSIQSFQQQQYMQYQQQIQQQQMPQQVSQQQQREQYLSDDFDIPMVQNRPSSSRMGSLTSQSAVNRLFRRNKGGAGASGPMDFDDNDGADIGDFSAGNVSFDDIRHMRDSGPYGMAAAGKSSDSAPIIPTLGAGNNLMGRKGQQNNIKYRKQMNHQKKLAYLQGARANSIAAGYNPIQGQQPQHHTYLMQAGMNPRMMSLGGALTQQGPPRAMSLSTNAMLQGGPRTMSMNRVPPMANGQPQYMPNMSQYPANQMNGQRQQVPTRNGQFPIGLNNGPRANSLQQGGGQFQGQGQSYQQLGAPVQYARTGSLQSGQMPNRNGPFNPGMNNNINMNNNMNMNNNNNMSMNMNGEQISNQQQYHNNNIQIPHSMVTQLQHVSNESLMNVLEEEEEPRTLAPPKSSQNTPLINDYSEKLEVTNSPKNIRKSMDLSTAVAQAAANVDEEEDEDVVYKFDDTEQSTLSRLPTLNKSNSMRLRKLDLFDKATTSDETPLRTKPTDKKPFVSPSFNIRTATGETSSADDLENRESMLINDEEADYDNGRRLSHHKKLATLGATASGSNNESNATTLTKDVFVTALDFNSDQSFNLNKASNPEAEQKHEKEEKEEESFDNIEDDIEDIKTRGSPVLHAVRNADDEDLNSTGDSDSTSILTNSRNNSMSSKPLQRHTSIQNLVANTAFSKFRSSSIGSESGFRAASMTSHGSPGGTFMSPSVRSASKFRSESPLHSTNELPVDELGDFPVSGSDVVQNEQKEQDLDLKESDKEAAVSTDQLQVATEDLNLSEKSTPAAAVAEAATPKKLGRRAPPSSMLFPVEIHEEKKNRQASTAPQPKVSNTLLPLDVDIERNSPISLAGDLSGDPASDALGTSSSKFSSSDKTTFDSSKDNINMSETLSVYNSSDLNDTMNSKDERNVQESASEGAIGSSARVSNATSSTSDVTKTPILEESETFASESKKSTPRSFSLKSRNLMNSLKRLPGRRSSQTTLNLDEDIKETSSPSSSKTRSRVSSFSSSKAKEPPAKPFKFTKEELAIMNCNNELLNELELVTTELASAVQRELILENRLRGGSSPTRKKPASNSMSMDIDSSDDNVPVSQYQQQIVLLQDKLNKERRLRFISEEHAILMENGITPSPIKLNYEKTEIYRQLLLKNDVINQLQDRIEEFENKYENVNGSNHTSTVNGSGGDTNAVNYDSSTLSNNGNANGNSMLENYNELLRENTDLKFKIIPDLEKKLQQEQQKSQKDHNHVNSGAGLRLKRSSYNGTGGMPKQLSLSNVSNELRSNGDEGDFFDEEYEFNQGQLEIRMLKNQREELREMISKLTSAHSYDSKLSQEKFKALEAKLADANQINEMLSRRMGGITNNGGTVDEDNDRIYKERAMNTSTSSLMLHSKGARLQGFNVVASTNTLFDT